MPIPETATLDALDSSGDGLRVSFFWRVDRYAHRIERIVAGAAVPLLESVEGNELDRWPPSPPLQQLSVETIPDGRTVALLVGMAGMSHWSLTSERQLSEPALLFDVACRFKEENAILGSAYRSLVRHESAGDFILLHRPGGAGAPAVLEQLELADSAAAPRIATDARGLRLVVVHPPGPSPQTVRWRYRVKLQR